MLCLLECLQMSYWQLNHTNDSGRLCFCEYRESIRYIYVRFVWNKDIFSSVWISISFLVRTIGLLTMGWIRGPCLLLFALIIAQCSRKYILQTILLICPLVNNIASDSIGMNWKLYIFNFFQKPTLYVTLQIYIFQGACMNCFAYFPCICILFMNVSMYVM